MRDHQEFTGFLELKGLIICGSSHEVGVTLIGLVIHTKSGCTEYIMGDFPSDLGDDTWLVRDHLINRIHVTGSGF